MSTFAMAAAVVKLLIVLQWVPYASARLLGSSFGLPIFDIFNVTAPVIFDYICVGAGTAGIAVAVRLAEAGNTVALIEAGSLHQLGNGNFSQVPLYASAFQHTYPGSLINPLVDWNLTTTPQAGLLRLYPQGKAVGGTSTRSHQAFTFAPKSSYQEWADAVGDQSYNWEGFSPHLIKPVNFTAPSSYRFPNSTARHPPDWTSHTSGPLQLGFSNYAWPWASWVKKALIGLGFEENPDGFVGGSLQGVGYQLSTLDATSFTKETSDSSYLERLGMDNENLVVYTNSLVTRILLDDSKTANGVEVDYGGLMLKLACRKEVIVSAGAFRSPQLLMLSGIGPGTTLEQHGISVVSDLAGVGQNLGDQVCAGISRRVGVPTTAELQWNEDTAAQALRDYESSPPRGPYTSYAGDLLAFEKLPEKYRQLLPKSVRESLDSLNADVPELEFVAFSAYGGPHTGFLGSPDGHNWATLAVAVASPFSRGNVSIASNRARDNPLVNPAWMSDTRDAQIALQAFRRLQEILNSTILAPVLVGQEAFPPASLLQTDAQVLEFVKTYANPLFQASGTAKMGRESDPMAVIDSKARVFGVNGVRVVDASALPVLLPGHIQGTIYGLAEKIADDIIRQKKDVVEPRPYLSDLDTEQVPMEM
ncbi:GMC oxidoreductase [Colletotrichum graminicola]|uniref:GMC oxidoreductase n=1 Tax=Colletotrichum graminicola (strain M1.001 / M2 / FGSC 10212) TaxID=645133 RepID=E3QX12_COLGM|nr:GMC oxidoreductase [Colletotrichum graminicola M1.001]EFQ35400.1 GMC oxidoreductase [Colletotrichum graminicola M1.001]WDK14952.1 GMC oxidoreductase [Colletotrichum graminicola]